MLAAVPGVRPAEARHLSGSFDADAARQLLARCRSEEIEIITLQDARYPRRLLYTDDAPVVLYVRGQLPEMDRFAAVGVVGTRSASPAALGTARQLGGELAACGALVVSGLSAGIDTAAAEGALAMQGAVVGVLGTAIDAPHPRHGAQLFSQICGSGALISELPPGYAARRWDIAARSRIISGLSVGVLVVEAPEQSGALHAAHAAEAQGRMIFAVPGSAGTDGLLREQAHSALCGWDVMAPFSVRFSSTVCRPTGEIIVPPPAPPQPKPAAPKRAAPKPSAPRTAASAPAASGGCFD